MDRALNFAYDTMIILTIEPIFYYYYDLLCFSASLAQRKVGLFFFSYLKVFAERSEPEASHFIVLREKARIP